MSEKPEMTMVEVSYLKWVGEQLSSLGAEAKTFPMQWGPPITMRTAKIIYAIYSDLFGASQSLEQIAERGGFGWTEVQTITKEFIHRRGRDAYDALLATSGEVENEDDKNRGLYRKYSVIRLSDPTGKHEGCMKFVLDLDHDPHALPAIKAYIESCEAEYPVLAADLAIALMRRTEKPTS